MANNEKREVQPRNISITQKLLCKIYGENCSEDMWPKMADVGGYVILGREVEYDEKEYELTEGPYKHTWCRWGWDMGTPIRFESRIDADMFVKTLKMPNERGRAYMRSYVPEAYCTDIVPEWRDNDDALPKNDMDYEEDND